ncbi:MAG TPA: TraM recognition domain-containing protein, partial [Wenzhouxiangella sp.]|nr:TraM recognition domain-containing protein [Wenzhouxiangella sp.]
MILVGVAALLLAPLAGWLHFEHGDVMKSWIVQYGAIAAAVAGMLALAAVARFLLPNSLIDDDGVQAARDLVTTALVRDIPDDAPEDLRDDHRLPIRDDYGRPIIDLQADDALDETLRTHARHFLFFAALPVVLLPLLFAAPAISGPAAGVIGLLLLIGLGMFATDPVAARVAEAEETAGQRADMALYVESGGDAAGMVPAEARKEQLERATIDETPFIKLGTSTGILEARGDPLAPNGGITFGYTSNDMAVPTIVLGGSGTGKTRGVLRPEAKQWTEKRAGGLLILDGKGQLPSELAPKIPGAHLVTPGHDIFSLTEGLEPAEYVSILETIVRAGESGDGVHWNSEGAHMMRQAATLLYHSQEPWTAAGVYRVCMEENYRQTVIAAIPESSAGDAMVEMAARYWSEEFEAGSANWKSSVQSTVRGWHAPILSHPQLYAWAEAEHGVDPAGVLRGEIIGFDVPASRFGSAAALISALAKSRVYGAAQDRGDNWAADEGQTPALLLIDEAQSVITEQDDVIAPIARSLGIRLVLATQTIEGMREQLGEAKANKLLEVCGNIIALPGRSAATNEWVAGRIGKTWRAKVKTVNGTANTWTAVSAQHHSGMLELAQRDPYVRGLARAGGISLTSHPFAAVSSRISSGVGAMLQEVQPRPTHCEIGLHPLI